MKLINKKRGYGKTTQLVYTSEVIGCPIVVATQTAKKHILWVAQQIGCDIPEPIVFSDETVLRGIKTENGILVDNAEFFLGHALEQYFGRPVIAATLSYERQNEGVWKDNV